MLMAVAVTIFGQNWSHTIKCSSNLLLQIEEQFYYIGQIFYHILVIIIDLYPYKGKVVSVYALQRTPALVVFSGIVVALFFLVEGLMMWATITEGLQQTYNTHHNLEIDCPTTKTGLFGGVSFLALDPSLFWLICQMLTLNAREDYELDDDEDLKGKYGQVMATDYNPFKWP